MVVKDQEMSKKEKSIGDIISKALKSVFNTDAEKKEIAEATLEDGTVLTAEAFEEGQILYIKVAGDGEAGDEFVVAPEGEYTLTDGAVLTVDAEGVISAITPAQQEEEQKEKEAKEEDMSGYVTREEFNDFAAELLGAVTKIVKVKHSAEKKEPEMSEEMKAKIDAAKAEFSRRKQIGAKDEKKEETESKPKEFKHKFMHPVKQRVTDAFKDFQY